MENKTKKGPGRPPKERKIPIQLKIDGIRTTPINNDNIVEFVYQSPKIFQKILSVLIGFNPTVIIFDFKEREIVISAREHFGQVLIYVTFNCEKVAHYYIKEPKKVYVDKNKFATFQRLRDKQPHRLDIFLQDEGQRKDMNIIVQNAELSKTDGYIIELLDYDESYVIGDIKNIEFPISFTQETSKFRQLLSEWSDLKPPTISFVKESDSDCIHLIHYSLSKIDKRTVFDNPENINFISTLKKEDLFSATINCKMLKSFSSSSLGNYIQIYCNQEDGVLFKTISLDDPFTINVFAQPFNPAE